MTSNREEQVQRLFTEAVELPSSRRAAFLDAQCPDPDVRREVETLLAHEPAVPADFLSELPPGGGGDGEAGDDPGPTVALPAGAMVDDVLPGHTGRYRIVAKLGEGGFGVVYEADQEAPLCRRVALKIIKVGMDTKQVIARFEAERQALALMDHPNIARVLDAGATHTGRPYFVMELVRGEPITHYCDREALTLRQRLELFRDVCLAVEHAHQKGVIHRDLKPSNILVAHEGDVGIGGSGDRGHKPHAPRTPEPSSPRTRVAQPKIIDFGIAKATAGRLTESTLITELHQLIGTPQYMSPEQADASGVHIDTRSDIYALGVILYELLTGSTPLEGRRLRSASLAEVQRLICEEEPPKPSTRLSSRATTETKGSDAGTHPRALGPLFPGSLPEVAARMRTDPKILTRQLRGDLDWIVMKCLEKDRGRRYAAASALADDVARYLECQPVLATPPSTGYRLQKFARRHRGAVIAAAVVAAALLIATGLSLSFAVSEARQRQSAEIARARAQRAEGEAKARAEELEQVTTFQEAQLSGIDAQTMGVRLRASLITKARAAAERSQLSSEAVNARVAELDELIAGSDFTGMALQALDDNFFQPALAVIDERFVGQPLVQARLLQTLAATVGGLGLLDAARGPQEEALAIRRRVLGDEHPDTLASINQMGDLLRAQGKLPEAEAYFREVLETSRRVLGDEHPRTLGSLNNLGLLLQDTGKLDDAERYLREAVEKQRRVLGDEHSETLASLNNLGIVLQVLGEPFDAELYFREALATRRRVFGDEHPETLTSISNLASLLQEQGKPSEAEPYYREALDTRRRVLGDDHPATLMSIENMSFLLQAQGKPAEAEPYQREALEKSRRILGAEHPDTLVSMNNMGMLLKAEGKLSEAEPFCREVVEKRRALLGNEHPALLISISNLGILLKDQGKFAEAEPYLREALETRRRVLGDGHSDTIVSINNVGALLRDQGRLAEAEPYCREALDSFRREYGDEHPTALVFVGNMGHLLQAQGKPAEAIALLAPAEPAIRQAFTGENAVRLGRFLTALGRARSASGEFNAAEANLSEAHAILGEVRAATVRDRNEVLSGLVELYEARHAVEPGKGHGLKAAEWRAKLNE